mmetsp:Transcript_40895/g.94982  ORF Transcript_40895/g.94982 Transcript_40895/m.94982 type:complete len:206 (+) Transcript_40895:28-645(+)
MGLKRPAEQPKEIEVVEIDDSQEAAQEQQAQKPVQKPRPQKDQALHLRFSPAVEAIDSSCCFARVQVDGIVGQCKQKRNKDWFCPHHTNGRWRILGRVDGPIPKAQLNQLLQKAASPPVPDSEADLKSSRTVMPKTCLEALEPRELSRLTRQTVESSTQEERERVLSDPNDQVSKILEQLEDDLWHEVQRVKQLDDGQATCHVKV